MTGSDGGAGAPYRRIAAEIRARIDSGALAVGDPVPSTRAITREWGVAMATASRALAVLRDEGRLRVLPGVGHVVAGTGVRRRVAARTVPGAADRPVRPPRAVTRDRIVRTGIAMADAEGLAAVSMRRIAAALGVPTMSLYRHVAGKDALVLLMADSAIGEEPLPAPATHWRDRLEQVARLQWRGYCRHPWLAPVVSMTRPQLIVNGVRHTERALEALGEAGLPPAPRLEAAVTLACFVRGVAVNLEPELTAEADSGLTDAEWVAAQEPTMQTFFDAGRFPQLRAVTEHPDVDLDLPILFEFGLRAMLDGIERRVAEQAR